MKNYLNAVISCMCSWGQLSNWCTDLNQLLSKWEQDFFFVRLDKLMLRFIWKVKGIRKAKSILNNKQKWITLHTLKIYSTATENNRLGLRCIRF